MAETGCLKDGNFQNLQVEGDTNVGTFLYREKISLLTNKGGAGAIRPALTMADSGTHFIVPPLTTGTQTLSLPTASAGVVGFTCKFTMLGTAGQIFSLDTVAGDDKITRS